MTPMTSEEYQKYIEEHGEPPASILKGYTVSCSNPDSAKPQTITLPQRKGRNENSSSVTLWVMGGSIFLILSILTFYAIRRRRNGQSIGGFIAKSIILCLILMNTIFILVS